MSEPRKATDVLVSIEEKLDKLISLLANKDFSDKILSNKLTKLLEELASKEVSTPKFTAEAVDSIQIKINPEDQLPVSSDPSSNGFRRTSRPETFSGDDQYIKKAPKKDNSPKMPIQVPKGDHVEIVVPQMAVDLNKNPTTPSNKVTKAPAVSNSVSVIQRIVDKNGKSVFLADVEILDTSNMEVVQKIKTNGAGKWMTSLPVGNYNITLRKRDAVTKQVVESQQTIKVGGDSNPLELPMMIIR